MAGVAPVRVEGLGFGLLAGRLRGRCAGGLLLDSRGNMTTHRPAHHGCPVQGSAKVHRQPSRSAFTLIEMLIVVTIISILSGMVMTMVGTVRRTSMKSATQSVERKVETALRLFKDEYCVYPYQNTYPAMNANAVGQAYNNNLYYRVGNNIDPTNGDRDNVISDIATAEGQYCYNATLAGEYGAFSEGGQPSSFTYRIATIVTTPGVHCLSGSLAGNNVFLGSVAVVVNKMAQEWVGNAMLAGAVNVKGQVIFDAYGTMIQDNSGKNILSSPATCASAAKPGWASDYLTGDIESRYIACTDILDAWHHPLVYICQALPAVKGVSANTNGEVIMPFDSRYYSLGAQGFDAGSGPTASVVGAGRRILLGNGRIRLSLTDAGDGAPTPVDATYYPTAGNLMQSDMRYYCAQGYETEFELWSAGFDGKFSYTRADTGNADNICATDFNRGLQ